MIKHIILWKLKDEFTQAKKEQIKNKVKETFEILPNEIENILKMKIITEGLETSTCDMMMDSEFTSFEALKKYKDHPAHLLAANSYVRPNVAVRLSMDYEI